MNLLTILVTCTLAGLAGLPRRGTAACRQSPAAQDGAAR
jgi:hypothetical protein